uniref:complement factor B isoform X2 n=1 Tax=Monopterus albus TaxID=43700 RepID=UPI0009B33898|nr:complement factor B-like isoform X2 [Monopterus albus]
MYVKSILWILIFISVLEESLQEAEYEYEYEDIQPLNCSTTESIKGGQVTYSQGGLEGSVLTYHCGAGRYPFPVSYRTCGADGDWSPMRLTSGRPVSQATCKDVMCPAQLQLDHGDFWPRDHWLRVGMTQSFSCQDGFTLYGSAQRNCTLSGEWTGTTPICDNHADECDDPGIPPGAQRLAGRFYEGEKVTYRCQSGLDLLGSAERVCLENREWSGSTPRCQGPNTFDSPSAVAEAMAGSLAGVMDVFSSDSKKKNESMSLGRTIRVDKDSRMNVYILLDTSGSIKKHNFEMSRNATIALIRKLDSYEVQLKFHVVSFASTAIDIVKITDLDSHSTDDIIDALMQFKYSSHGKKTGTNMFVALQRVNEMISFFKQNRVKYHFNETQNIIIIVTDGYSNTGEAPENALTLIRHSLDYYNKEQDNSHERLLDVYVFGVGDQVNRKELNALASHKRDEEHVFILEDFNKLGQVFNKIISDKSVTACGIAQELDLDMVKGDEVYTRPWHVILKPPVGLGDKCSGSILSEKWVLTAAHCFAKTSANEITYQVTIHHGGGTVESKKIFMHPKYNVYALKHRNVSEFYDYDIALIELNNSIPLSWKARPICLPCTVPASRALKKINSTCQQHRKELLQHEETAAFFLHTKSHLTDSQRKVTHIHTERQRAGCVEKARQTLKEPTNVTLDEYIPKRFLCTGGTSRYQDAISCKGDSGGSLVLQKLNRYFQVGVLSWGTTNVCDRADPALKGYSRDRPPPNARDFHIDVFQILPWLKKHLGEEIQFLPGADQGFH